MPQRPRFRLRPPRWRVRSTLPFRSFAALLSVSIAFLLLLYPAGVHSQSYDSEDADRSSLDVFSSSLFSGSLELARSLGLPFTPAERRGSSAVISLKDGEAGNLNIAWGESRIWTMSSSEVFSRDTSSDRRTIHLSFNTCLQPQPNSTATKKPDDVPPQLEIYVSNTTANQSPGPNVTSKPQMAVSVDRGFAELSFEATGDVWVGVYAPSMPTEEKGLWDSTHQWNYDIALSTDTPYYRFEETPYLYLVDTDYSTALLITGNMTSTSGLDGGYNETLSDDDLMVASPPYTMYAQNVEIPNPALSGLEKSFCAVSKSADIQPGSSLDTSMTTRGLGNHPKQQFHMKSLNHSSSYYGFLARPANSTNSSKAGSSGGVLWGVTTFTTKADGNCQIIYDLPFCSEVAYAVPSNPTIFNATGLMNFYDNGASAWWANFSYSLQQVQCNATAAGMYSIVRNCDDCASAYKNWLCAVTIPRCEDYSSDLQYLSARSSTTLFYNATTGKNQSHAYTPALSASEEQDFFENPDASGGANGTGTLTVNSRNPNIDAVVKPGAYKEVKPCIDLCWSLVQSCPSSFNFNCPKPDSWGEAVGYGYRSEDGDVTCSFLGAVYFLSAAPEGRLRAWWGGGGGGTGGLVAGVLVGWVTWWAL